jgi:uncharacterized protein
VLQLLRGAAEALSTSGVDAVEQRATWTAVLAYLAIAFGLAWAVQIGLALAARGGPGALNGLAAGQLVVAAALMWPPALGAFVVRRWIERSGFADAGLRLPHWRYVVLAWFGPAILTLLALLVSLPIYPLDTNFTSLRQVLAASGQNLPISVEMVLLIQVLQGLTVGVAINVIFAFGEEFGWRGYLLRRLMTLLGPWAGLLAHGAIWGFWHAPLILLTGYNYPQHPQLGVLFFIVFGMLAGVLLGWLQLASDSVWPPTIAHAALNAIAALPLFMLAGVDTGVAGVIFSPVGWLVLLAAIGILVTSGALPRALRAGHRQPRTQVHRLAWIGLPVFVTH